MPTLTFKKAYCGLFLYSFMEKGRPKYLCMDAYTKEIKCQGDKQTCYDYYDNYVNEVAERD